MERGNLVRAYVAASRGRRWREEVRVFGAGLEENLRRMRREVESGEFSVGSFRVFEVRDPKVRTIHAVRFEERVFQQALMGVCEPILERRAIFGSYACRKGKGQVGAVRTAEKGARGYGWALKLDIRKYFQSVPQERLMGRLGGVFKDERLMWWLGRIVRSYRGVGMEGGLGLPIGSLTSQHLANFYLGSLDRFCLGEKGVGRYVRYMDDFVCWGRGKGELGEVGKRVERFVEEELGLRLKYPPAVQPTERGMDFLGYRVFRSHLGLSRRSKVRYGRRMRALRRLDGAGRMTERGMQERQTALTSFAMGARSWGFRVRVAERGRIWSAVSGHEPGESGRELEQHREQRAGVEPEQQQPVEQQQQQRVSSRAELRSRASEDAESNEELNRPSSCSGPETEADKREGDPSGAGRPAEAGSKVPGGSFLRGNNLKGKRILETEKE